MASRVSVRFRHVIFPIDIRDFVNVLSDLTYEITAELPPEPHEPSPRVAGAGPVATKGEFAVDINTEKQFFGVRGPLVEALDELIRIFETLKPLGIRKENVFFYEAQSRYKALIPDAAELLFTLEQTSPLAKIAGGIFDADLGLLTARVVSKDTLLDSPDYLEIFIQPTLTRPTSEMEVRLLFRNADLSEFRSRVADAEQSVQELLSALPAPDRS